MAGAIVEPDAVSVVELRLGANTDFQVGAFSASRSERSNPGSRA